ncbi:MAG TPA: GNAT family N-acetyltransferase [Planctomycetaceae bacterium]|nr:GNAT family N-acetyltransferase [Planctomycetaceae bacterium]
MLTDQEKLLEAAHSGLKDDFLTAGIRQARTEDVSSLMAIKGKVIAHLLKYGIDQWDEVYPAEADFLQDVYEQTLHVLESAGQIVGGLCLNEVELDGYETASWQAESFLVVHRLLIDPDFQGSGYGRQLMQFAEQQTYSLGKNSIRLDCFTENPAAISFYQKLNYRICGEVTFRKGRFLLMEKVLRPHEKSPTILEEWSD